MRLGFVRYVSLVLLCYCLTLPAQTQAATTDSTYRNYLLQVIALLQQQIQILQADLVVQQAAESETWSDNSLTTQVDMVSLYNVTDLDNLTAVRDEKQHLYFVRVAELVPEKYKGYFTKLGVYTGDADFDAFVETIPPQHETWLYAAHEDMLSEPAADWNTELIVHEIGHVVSLDAVPNLTKYDYYACVGLLAVAHCPPVDSYVGQFITEFWGDGRIMLVRQARENNRLEEYYRAHDDEFVSEYASSAPEEDFAESFMFYALDKGAIGSVAEDKIAFFGRYQVFADIRKHVIAVP